MALLSLGLCVEVRGGDVGLQVRRFEMPLWLPDKNAETMEEHVWSEIALFRKIMVMMKNRHFFLSPANLRPELINLVIESIHFCCHKTLWLKLSLTTKCASEVCL